MPSEHDTHGATGTPWYGFDLDGTLAEYHGWQGVAHIGKPIKPMCDLAKRLHAEGKLVKIVTARVAPRLLREFPPYWGEQTGERFDSGQGTYVVMFARDFIKEWCQKHLGFVPDITHQKDHLMLWLVDDRTVQVEPNTGRVLGRLPVEMKGTQK